MKLKHLTPLLRTENLRQTIDFYENVLGFECIGINEDLGWCTVARDNVDLMFSRPNARIPLEKPACTGSFYFYLENVEALWNELKDKTKIVYPIKNFEHGMREFAVYDNNGYMLQFGQEISS